MALISEYGFNEGSGSTANDSSGNGYDIAVSSARWSVSGHTLGGLDGPSPVSNQACGPASTGTALSFMLWVKANDSNGGTVVSITNGSNHLNIWVYLGDLGVGLNGGDLAYTSFGTPNQWHHLAATITSGGTFQFYVDGAAVGSAGAVGTNWNAAHVYVGQDYTGGDTLSPGTVDDLRFFNTALSSGDVSTWMGTPVVPAAGERFASGSVTLAGSAARVIRLARTASPTATLYGSVAAVPALARTAAGALTLAGSGDVGAASVVRAADGSLVLAGSATRSVRVVLTAAGALSLAGTVDVAGAAVRNAAGALALSGSAVRAVRALCTAEGLLGVAGVAEVVAGEAVASRVTPLGEGNLPIALQKIATTWTDANGTWVLASFDVDTDRVLAVRVRLPSGLVVDAPVSVRPAIEFGQAVVLIGVDGNTVLSVALLDQLLDLDGDSLFGTPQVAVKLTWLPSPFNRMTGYRSTALLKENGLFRQVEVPADEELSAADLFYLGGRRYRLTAEEAEDLVSAGYSEWLTANAFSEDAYGEGAFNSGVFGA